MAKMPSVLPDTMVKVSVSLVFTSDTVTRPTRAPANASRVTEAVNPVAWGW